MRLASRLRAAIAIALLAPACGADPVLVSDDRCGCFTTRGNTAAYFTNHFFHDFRYQSQYARVPRPIASADASTRAPETSAFFTASNFTSIWQLQTWNNSASLAPSSDGSPPAANVLMVNSANNIYIESDDDSPSAIPGQTRLTMRTARFPKFQSAAEIETASEDYRFVSIRMLARTLGPPGACTALFTYRAPPASDSGNIALVQEADFETLTRDAGDRIQLTNQPSFTPDADVIPGSTLNATLPSNTSREDWAVYRLDWTPGLTTWYVNEVEIGRLSFQAPRDPSQLIINSWGDGGSWTGPMAVGSEAVLQVRWIEAVYNVSKGRPGRGGPHSKWLWPRGDDRRCNRVCSIDETTVVGTPALLWDNAATSWLVGSGVRSIAVFFAAAAWLVLT